MSASERTEKPTAKKKADARKKGEVSRSAELPQGVSLVITVLLLPVVFPRLVDGLSADWEATVLSGATLEPNRAPAVLGQFLSTAAVNLLPLIAALAFTGVVAQLAMVGPKPNPHQLKPKFKNLNPKNGIKRLFSAQSLWDLLKTAAKLGALTLVTVGVWKTGVEDLAAGGGVDVLVGILGRSIFDLLVRVAALAALIGLADAAWSKRRHLKQLKMSKHDVKEEHKQAEGSPHVKAELRKKAMKLSRMRMMAEVARADVVITNPTHYAVALAYEDGATAPVLVAKGTDAVARRIKEEARKHKVPIKQNKPLARTIYATVELGEAIPATLFRAVAEVLAAVYRARQRKTTPRAVAA